MRNKAALPFGKEGEYKVLNQRWSVGSKYILHEHIGSGSYGDVCRATDLETNMIVAIKRVKDILSSPMLAKRILREVCIMRRLANPYIISLTDVFVEPSLEVENGYDLYMVTEFAHKGDVYHFSEPISADDAKLLIWQLLMGVKYMHACRVWHRDIKSENVLMTAGNGVKICDFGLARSAEEAAIGYEPILENRVSSKVLTRQYTKMVVTPSYRAPEVIMSRGEYNSTIDIWSLGCIFWELLVRSICHTVGPPDDILFSLSRDPKTPKLSENYATDARSPLADQLDVIFNVIGTPCWKDIQSVPSENWRAYLKGLPGRAGNLVKTLLGSADEDAIDLLSRMLAFNPARRCTAEEALAHTYFKNIKKPTNVRQLVEDPGSAVAPGAVWKIRDPSIALEQLERELEASEGDKDGGKNKLFFLLMAEVQHQQQQNFLKRSFLCSLRQARLKFLGDERKTSSLQGQTSSCTCASCIVESSSASHGNTSDQAPKPILHQGPLRTENGGEADDRAAFNALLAPVLGVAPQMRKTRANHASQWSNNSQEVKGGKLVNVAPLNGTQVENGKRLGDGCLPRRSPRILRDEVTAIPAGKRARMQVG